MANSHDATKQFFADQALLPGTVSQFILPFSYACPGFPNSIKNLSSNHSPLLYKPQDKIDDFEGERKEERKLTELAASPHVLQQGKILRSRQDYFAVDTHKALFERASWYSLHGTEKLCIAHYGDFEVMAQKVQMVLFEEGEVKGDFDELRTGFLILDVYLAHPSRIATVNELLNFNYAFRYMAPPFAGYEHKKNQKWCPAFTSVVDLCGLKSEIIQNIEDFNPENDITADKAMRFAGMFLQFLMLPIQHKNNGTLTQLVSSKEAVKSILNLGLLKQEADNTSSGCDLLIYPDHRLFSRCYAEMPKGAFDLTPESPENGALQHSSQWIKLLNVERAPEQIELGTEFEMQWIDDKRTYQRWQHLGTLYGFGYNSCALLAEPCDDPPLKRHFTENYLDTTLLLLFARVTLFRFSNTLNAYTQKVMDEIQQSDDTVKDNRSVFEKLRFKFSLFVNLYKFPLISNQQQAIEMYSLQRETMDIDELFQEIDSEINSTHEALQLIETHQQTSETQTLNKTVLYVGLLGVIATLFTINDKVTFFKKEKDEAATADKASSPEKGLSVNGNSISVEFVEPSSSHAAQLEMLADETIEKTPTQAPQPKEGQTKTEQIPAAQTTRAEHTEYAASQNIVKPSQEQSTEAVTKASANTDIMDTNDLTSPEITIPQTVSSNAADTRDTAHISQPANVGLEESSTGYALTLDVMWIITIALCTAILINARGEIQDYISKRKIGVIVFLGITITGAVLAQLQIVSFPLLSALVAGAVCLSLWNKKNT